MDWFRMYSEFASDPKVQSMSEAMQRRLVMLLCLRCSNTLVTLQDDEISFALRISNEELAETKALFMRKNFITEDWEIKQWDKRQFASDSSAARVARHRARQKEQAEVECNVTVTPQNRTDTEQIQNREEQKKETPSAAPKYSPSHDLIAKGVDPQIAADWLAVRKGKKAASTKTAIDAVLEKILAAGLTVDAGLRICCERGWAGFNIDWLQGGQARASPAPNPAQRNAENEEAKRLLFGRKQSEVIDV